MNGGYQTRKVKGALRFVWHGFDTCLVFFFFFFLIVFNKKGALALTFNQLL